MIRKDLSSQLEASKSSIKDLFNDLLYETKGFQYQFTVKILLKNTNALKLNFPQFISIQKKAVIYHKCYIDKSFQETFYRIDNWINEGSGWIAESMEFHYYNI